MFTYLLAGSFGEYFFFYGLTKFYIYIALAWKHRYFLPKILFRFFTRSPGMRLAPSVHDDISLQNSFSLSLFPLSKKGCYFRFRILANHLAFFLPFPGHRMQTSVGFHSVGDLFGLLSLSPEWGYGVQIAWPTFFIFSDRPAEVDLHSSFNGHSLAAC